MSSPTAQDADAPSEALASRQAFPLARVRPQPQKDGAHFALVLTLSLLCVPAYLVGAFWGVLFWLGAVVTPSTLLLAWQRRRTPKGGSNVELGPNGLYADGRLLVPKKDIKRALVMTEESGKVVVSIQRTQGFFVALDVPSEEEGNRIVRALGLAAEQSTADLVVASPLATHLPQRVFFLSLAAVLGASLSGIMLDALWGWLLLVPPYLSLLAWLHPTKLTIGTDGILLSWLWQKRHLRYSEMRGIAADKTGLRFDLSDGRSVRVGVAAVMGQRDRVQPEMASDEAYVKALVDRIEKAKAAAGGVEISVLERKERPIEEWVAHLRSLVARGAAGFREAPVAIDALWRTVESGHAEPSARVAAAVALTESLDETGRERLRVAAKVVASPKLRVALSSAAEGDEKALTDALAELEAHGREEKGRSRARRS